MEKDGENEAFLDEHRKTSGKYFPQKRLTVLSCGFFVFFLLYIFWMSYLDVTTSFSFQSVYTFITPTNNNKNDNKNNSHIELSDEHTMQIIYQNESTVQWSTAVETPFSDSKVRKIEDDMPDAIQWYTVPDQYDKNDKWYLSVMSAFYDYRIEKIVVLLASDAASQIEKNAKSQPKFTCVYFYDNLTYTATVEGYFYTSYIFYCPMLKLKRFKNVIKRVGRRDRIPEAISLIRNDTGNEDVINWTIPIVNLYQRKIDRFSTVISDQNATSSSNLVDNAQKLAVCVGIMFGYQPWLTVLQYIEFHRMQGVEKFLFFYSNMHESVKEIFEWYKINVPGLIETIYWLPPHFTCDHEYRCQLLRDNYCSYALMHKYKYVANSDYDELFYPAAIENKTLVDLLDEINDETRGSFTFRAVYHQILLKDTPEWSEISADNASDVVSTYLPLYHFKNVSSMAGHFYSPKTITKPETVLKRWIHFVDKHVKGTSIYHPTENEGFLRHFKVRTWWGGWADNADQEVKYHMVDPHVEIGNSTLAYLMGQISDVAAQCKLAKMY